MYIVSYTFLALLGLASATQARQAPPKGKKIQYVSNSFHWWLAGPTGPVALLAKEAGIVGHEDIGVDRIPGSTPCQHWTKGGETNAVKVVLKAGKADVLTLVTREQMPDDCMPKFVALANSKRKDMRVMVQENWLVQSANPKVEACKDGKELSWGCSDRDGATYEMLEQTRTKLQIPYRTKLRAQVDGLNAEFGKNFTTIVPIYDAVLTLREMVVNGKFPGVAKQSALFMDSLGHPKNEIKSLAGHMWFAAMYGINPVGMKAYASVNTPEQTKILQELAWETLNKEPFNGL
ncbi:hypothetical protein BT63DRAFT_128548 [Microthyrium microscopicum]|uniref:Uncharacterized protein n=1 Tax=Microthyrium microscopicum TaxID=703497 RepID=A0A6A6TVG2_9PEZI|nr:hypothetical protein BT63DRAFT_128548 [Microthyrium microscopicum]